MSNYLSWSALTAEEQARAGNGCGPSWSPRWVRAFLFGWFFIACCNHHDFGYEVGGNELRRWVCDWKFFIAMLQDAFGGALYWLPFKLPLALFFYLCVMLGGWVSFRYGRPIQLKVEFDQI